MSGFELNKIAAAVLLAGLIGMVAGKVAEALYEPLETEKRGFEVAVSDKPTAGGIKATEVEEKVDLAALLVAANADAGAKSVKKCAACHNFDKGGKNLVGPNMWNIVNNDIAAKQGYAYSSALSGLGGNWTVDNLYQFLKNPRKYASGTKMAFAGIKKPEEIANIIAYLKTLK